MARAAPARRRRSDGARRHDAILDAALRCFAKGGVLGVGIEDVRREAGASPSSMYHLFGDLEGIVVALLARVFDALFAHIAARLEGARSAREAVHALVDAHLEWALAHPREARFMYQATMAEGPSLRAASRRRLLAAKGEALAPILERREPHVRAGELPPWSPALLDVVLLGPSHEGLRRWLAGASELLPDLLRPLLPSLAWQSVRQHRASGGARARTPRTRSRTPGVRRDTK
ncbi:MAG: TetR/AcrR family transcriptional regulator [Myxococcales bacterium]|nr:TetR/AcrR family transcriptional regulator [Myxococcales bacterium]